MGCKYFSKSGARRLCATTHHGRWCAAADYAVEDSEKITEMVRGELATIMGVHATPDFIKSYRHDKSIPQYSLGHAQRLEAINQQLQQHPNLILTGNAYKGVALNDCVANAYRIAESLAK